MPPEKSTLSLKARDLCFIDVETTGVIFGYHELIEIGIIRVSVKEDWSYVETEWSGRFNPQYPERLTEVAKSINGYDPLNWSDKSLTEETWKEIFKFVDDGLAVCHNPSFDRAFMSLSANQFGLDLNKVLPCYWLGTESLAWPFFVRGDIPGISLHSMAQFFGVDEDPLPHRAINGARTCRKVFNKLSQMYSGKLSAAVGSV